MLRVIAVLATCLLATVSAVTPPSRAQHIDSLLAARSDPRAAFSQWMTLHNKPYSSSNDASALESTYAVWLSNLEFSIQYNEKHTTHWLGMNSLADLTKDQYRQRLGYNNTARKTAKSLRQSSPFQYADVASDSLPAHIDWRALGAVAEVKNQGQCGSCWAFSTTGSVEGINAIFSKSLVSLSEQELVDCDTVEDKGCGGGLMDYAYQWIIENRGIDTERDYPYTASDDTCNERKRKRMHVVTIDGFEDVPENDESALRKVVAHQPVSVAIEADQTSFQLYVGGVYDDVECGTTLDHGVLVVGYGVEPGAGTYWIVKNSWGGDWGDSGYIKLRADSNAKEGTCGVAMAASYPLKHSTNPPTPSPEPPSPPSPKPKPTPPSPATVQCDETNECPAGNTCCCAQPLFGMCFQWGCCPIKAATCCDDNEHCCPESLPVCDTTAGRCLAARFSLEGSSPWMERTMATHIPSWWEKMIGRTAGAAPQFSASRRQK
ncbi:MAG: hypothetical protein WDW38_000564 [Sanguina aurantia]